MLNILFVTPRFHTNQIGWIDKLSLEGHKVSVYVLNKAIIEDHSLVNPFLLYLSTLSRVIIKLFGPGGANLYRGFPPIESIYRKMKSEKADFIIVRDAFRWMSFLIIVIARIQRINIVVYSQTQVNEKKTFIKLILYRFVLYLSRRKCRWLRY